MALPIIVRDPEIGGGIPCFRGTRVPFQNLLDYLEQVTPLTSSWSSSRLLPVKWPSRPWRPQRTRSSRESGEDSAGRICLPKDLWKHLIGHECQTVPQAGLPGKANGELLVLAERSGWQALLTMDRGIPHQQNVAGRTISLAIIRAKSNRLTDLLPHVPGS